MLLYKAVINDLGVFSRKLSMMPCDQKLWLSFYYCYYFFYFSGVVLPVWNPQNPSVGDKVARAIVYFVALIYMFLGMSIIADRFMSSIEVCTIPSKALSHHIHKI